MNILMLSPFLPTSSSDGGAPRVILDRLQMLSERHRVTVVAITDEAGPDRATAGEGPWSRLVAVRRPFASVTRIGRLRKRLCLAVGLIGDDRPMLVQEFGGTAVCAAILRLLRSERFDVVLVEHILMAQYASCLDAAGPVRIVLTDHDAAAVDAPAAGRSGQSRLVRLIRDLDRDKWRRYIAAADRRASVVVVPTERDAALVRQRSPGAEVRVVPFGVPHAGERSREELPCSGPDSSPSATLRQRPAGDRAPSLLFVGHFAHGPNRDAARWLCAEIMPRLWRSRPDIKLVVVGRQPTSDLLRLASAGISILADVPTIAPYLAAADLFVAPIRQGAGTRVKLLEALAAGVPVITTSIGATGLGAVPGRDLVVADEPEAFVAAVLALLADRVRLHALGDAGRRLVSAEARRAERLALLEQALH